MYNHFQALARQKPGVYAAPMTVINSFMNSSVLDLLAFAGLVVGWLATGWLTEHPPAHRPSVSVLMNDYRRDWMRQFVTRDSRIFDATVVESLRQGTAFFASAAMIAIGGGVALLGNAAMVKGLAAQLALDEGSIGIELKIIIMLTFLANALLKFIWSNRLFGYCSIMMAAVPNDRTDPHGLHRAAQAAEVNITAARSFNRGLRAIYFALAALAWLAGPLVMMLATAFTTGLLIRREFASVSREVILHRKARP
jgi:uncharacterized membrane protein